MPTEPDGANAPSPRDPAETDAAQRAGARLVIGVAGMFILGMILNWPMAFVAAVFAAMFLQAPGPLPGGKAVALIFVSLTILIAGWLVASLALPYPVLFMSVVIGGVVLAYSRSVGGANPLMVVLLLLGALLIPYLVRDSHFVGLQIAIWLPVNMALALVASWLAFALIPPAQNSVRKAAAEAAAAPKFDPERRLLRMSLVSVPFAVLFFLSGSGAVVTLLFTAILSQQLAASTGTGPAVAAGMMKANLLGGFAAILAYETVVIAPVTGVMMLVSLLLCLALGRWYASGRPDAALAGSALTTALILFGGSMAPFGDDADVKMFDRLFQVGFALVYTLTAFIVVDAFLPEREEKPVPPDWKRTERRGRGRNPTAQAHRA